MLIYVHLIFIYFKVAWVICSGRSRSFGTREGPGCVQHPPGPVTWLWAMLRGWDVVPSPQQQHSPCEGDIKSGTCRAAPPPGHPPILN